MRLLGTPALFQGLRCDSKTPSVVKKEQVSAADDIFDTLVVNDDFCLIVCFLFHLFFVIQFVWTFPFFLTCSCICDKTSNPFLILQLPVYMYLMDYDYFYPTSIRQHIYPLRNCLVHVWPHVHSTSYLCFTRYPLHVFMYWMEW